MAEPAATHYDTLGVPADADIEAIRRAYRALARRFHPDRHAGRSPAERAHAERRMRDVNRAWTALSDPGRRRSYDATLARGRAGAPRAGPAPGVRVDGRRRPEGRRWQPRAGDDGWMDDFEAWRREVEHLGPDRPGPRRPVRVLPAAVLVVAAGVGVVGLVLGARPVLAVAFMIAGLSAALWVWLPFVEMARGQASDRR